MKFIGLARNNFNRAGDLLSWWSLLPLIFISFQVFSGDIVPLHPRGLEVDQTIKELQASISFYKEAKPRPKRALMADFEKAYSSVPSQLQDQLRDIAFDYLNLKPEQWMADYWVTGRIEDYKEVSNPIRQAAWILEAYAKKQSSYEDSGFKDNIFNLIHCLEEFDKLPQEIRFSVIAVTAKLKEVLILDLRDYRLAESIFTSLENITRWAEAHPAQAANDIGGIWITMAALSNYHPSYHVRMQSLLKRLHEVAPSYESAAALLAYGIVDDDLVRRMIDLHYNSFVFKFYEEVLAHPQPGLNPGIIYSKLTSEKPIPDIKLIALAERSLINLSAKDPKIKSLLLSIKTSIIWDYSKNRDKGKDGVLHFERRPYADLAERYLTDLMQGRRTRDETHIKADKNIRKVLQFPSRPSCDETLDKPEV